MNHFASINIVASMVAALSGFVIGGLWYGPLFQKQWMRYSGTTFGAKQSPLVVFGGAYLLNLVVALSLAFLMGPRHSWLLGAHTGFFAGLTLVGAALGVIHLFESRPWQLWLINTAYQTLNFAAMGAIVGAWK